MAILRKRVATTNQTFDATGEANPSLDLSNCPSLSSSIDTVNTSSLSLNQLPEYSAQDAGASSHEEPIYPLYENDSNTTLIPQESFASSSKYLRPLEQNTQSNSEFKTGHYTCSVIPTEPAAWYWPRKDQHLGNTAVDQLSSQGLLEVKDLQPLFSDSQNEGPADPISGLALATVHTVQEILGGAVDVCERNLSPTHDTSRQDSPRGITRIVVATLRTPRDFTLALTNGFHNAPRLYGEHTTRPEVVITGMGSGVVAAGKGLATGLYDGLSGFVMQPVRGAKKDGVFGAVKGVGKGVGGLVCSVSAGACGVPAYALQGVHVEIGKVARRLKREDFSNRRLNRLVKAE